MARVHVIKRTNTEVVLKCYVTDASGGTIDILPDSTTITGDNEVYTPGTTCKMSIKAIYWGAKKDKQIDITRIVPEDPSGVHSHYYLLNAGSYQYQGFVDEVYGEKPIRIIGDGPFHVMLVLGKKGWKTKIQPEQFGQYDNPNEINS